MKEELPQNWYIEKKGVIDMLIISKIKFRNYIMWIDKLNKVIINVYNSLL